MQLNADGHEQPQRRQSDPAVETAGSLRLLLGEIDWHSRSAGLKVKKQKQELSRRLRDFFRIEDDPIEWVKDTRGYYRCKFTILPVGGDEG